MANYAISKHRTCGCIDLRVKFKNVKFETADVYNYGIRTAAPAQDPRGPALLMASPPRKQYILLLNPQRTCAGPAWIHAIQRAVCEK